MPDWSQGRVVAHLDLDCFFAQVEELDDPSLRGKPLVVGGVRKPDGSVGRGIVCTSNYAARAFGVRTAMPLVRALRLCPHANFVRPRGARYRELSDRVFEVCRRFTPVVDRVGIDECYLDLTGLDRWLRSTPPPPGAPPEPPKDAPEFAELWPRLLAQRLRTAIRAETGLTASVGVAPNRFLAKIASDHDKPDGLTVVHASDAVRFVAALPLRDLRGVGPATERSLNRLGLRTAADLVERPRQEIEALLGEFGASLWDNAHGTPSPPFAERDARKSISRDRTFHEDVTDRDTMLATLAFLTEKACFKLRHEGLKAGCIGVRIRFADFTQVQRDFTLGARPPASRKGPSNDPGLFAPPPNDPMLASATPPTPDPRPSTHAQPTHGFPDSPTDHDAEVFPVVEWLFHELITKRASAHQRAQPVRLVGVKLSHLTEIGGRQLRFGEAESIERRAGLYKAADAIRERYGFDAVSLGRSVDLRHANPRGRKQ